MPSANPDPDRGLLRGRDRSPHFGVTSHSLIPFRGRTNGADLCKRLIVSIDIKKVLQKGLFEVEYRSRVRARGHSAACLSGSDFLQFLRPIQYKIDCFLAIVLAVLLDKVELLAVRRDIVGRGPKNSVCRKSPFK